MPSYSTLEVCEVGSNRPYDYSGTHKEAIRYPDNAYPQPAPFEVNEPGGYFPEVVENQTKQPSDNTRICGLPKRVFYYILIAVVLAGALAGGLAGGLSSRSRSPSEPSNDSQEGSGQGDSSDSIPSTNNRPNVNILDISRITSTNMTDSKGYTHRTVFFQDTYNSILARAWDSQNTTWTTNNITELMRDSMTPLSPLPGAPMASAACSYGSVFEVHLWFMAPNNYINTVALWKAEEAPDNWERDTVFAGPQTAHLGSQLAAAWQRCWSDSCIGNWALAYQTPQGDINIANATDWGNPTTAIEARAVADNSSLCILPQLLGRLVLASESLSSGTTGTMQKSVYEDTWESDGILIDAIPLPQQTLQFAYMHLRNFTQTMFLSLLPNGTVTAWWWGDHRFETVPSINFHGGPSVNFTAISGTEDAMLYGISNDEVLQYEVDGDDISSFIYVGRVYP